MGKIKDYKELSVTLKEAVSVIKSGDKIAAGPAASFPLELMNALTKRDDIRDITLYTALITTLPDFINPENSGKINYHSLFMGPMERAVLSTGIITPISLHFHQMADYFREQELDAVLLEVSPPDEFGYMSLGPSAPMAGRSAFEHAKKVIVQINPNVPFLNGNDVHIHINETDFICEVERPLFELPDMEESGTEKDIASLISPMICDGATLQLGIGQLANAIGENLHDKKDLGVHTEMITPSMIELFKKGVITGRKKDINKGKMIASFLIGKEKDYEFLHRNPAVELHPTRYVNNPYIIGQHKNLISVNNALSADLTGQVSSESIGFKQFSATGGQLDFVRGASISRGGKSFITLESTAKKGTVSRITLAFEPGTAVTTPRSDVEFIVTEFGIADLKRKNIPQRVIEMIKIAHPKFRDELAKEAVEKGLVSASDTKKIDKAA
jgi:4-hydroxybutyrate CoA-transferase